MSNEFLPALFGIIGVIIGSSIPLVHQTVRERKNEEKELRKKSIEKMKEITTNLNKIENIINIIINFLDDDYDDYEYDIDRDFNFKSFCKIYSKNYPYFWDDIIPDLYLILPDTTRTVYFNILNNVMLDTKYMVENINEYFEDEQITYEKIKRLQKSFEQDRNKYLSAMYTKILLLEELQNNISGNKNKLSKKYYLKYESKIINAIEHGT